MSNNFSILALIFLFSCNPEIKNENIKEKLTGTWIPKTIKWVTDSMEVSTGLVIHKEANTVVLDFEPDSKGKIIYTTISLGQKDTLNIQVDIFCEHIKWAIDVNNIFSVVGLKSPKDKIIIKISKDTVLTIIYNGQEYIKTKMFDSLSLNEIKTCPLESNP